MISNVLLLLVSLTALLLLCSPNAIIAFAPPNGQEKKHRRSTQLPSLTTTREGEGTRRSFFQRITGSAASVAAAVIIQAPESANAFGGGVKKANVKLSAFGLPTIDDVPRGFSPLVEIYGKGKNRSPLLVQFAHPLDWVVVIPSQDLNGEDGTIQAVEYSKGDSATLFVYKEPGKVENIAEQSKDFFQNAIIKSISQKGDNVYQNFKVTNIEPRKSVYNKQDYAIVDFKYELLTGAGFVVDRKGIASVTSAGDAVDVLWCASTRQRYKNTEVTLRSIADSFRCYADGLDLAVDLKNDDYLER